MAKKQTKLDDALKRRGLNMMKRCQGMTEAEKDSQRDHNRKCGMKMRYMAGKRVDTGLMGLMDEEECSF